VESTVNQAKLAEGNSPIRVDTCALELISDNNRGGVGIVCFGDNSTSLSSSTVPTIVYPWSSKMLLVDVRTVGLVVLLLLIVGILTLVPLLLLLVLRRPRRLKKSSPATASSDCKALTMHEFANPNRSKSSSFPETFSLVPELLLLL